jgi:hypothetical protein
MLKYFLSFLKKQKILKLSVFTAAPSPRTRQCFFKRQFSLSLVFGEKMDQKREIMNSNETPISLRRWPLPSSILNQGRRKKIKFSVVVRTHASTPGIELGKGQKSFRLFSSAYVELISIMWNSCA